MIYKFKRWMYLPYVTEVFINANTDKEALETFNQINLKTLSWKECGMIPLRMTYEVVKDVKVKDTTHRTVDKFREES